MRSAVAAAAILALICPLHASSAIVQYSSRAAFTAAAGAVTIEDFESFTPNATAFRNTIFDFGDFTGYNGPHSGTGFGGDIYAPGTVNGSTDIIVVLGTSGARLDLVFDYPITAIGFDAEQMADQRHDEILFNNLAGDVVPVTDPIDQVRFWGFISDTPFTTFTMRQTGWGTGGGPTDGFHIDDLTYNVPEPGAAAFMIVALLAAYRRRNA